MMNKEPRDITIENAAFSLTIHWNPEVVMTQLCILTVCVLAIMFVPNAALKSLAKWLIVIDVVSIVIGLLFKKDKAEAAKEKKQTEPKPEVKREEKPASVETSSPAHQSTHVESGNTVHNKLDIATPKSPVTSAPPAPAPIVSTSEAPKESEAAPATQVPNDVRAAFEDFFSFDLDDE